MVETILSLVTETYVLRKVIRTTLVNKIVTNFKNINSIFFGTNCCFIRFWNLRFSIAERVSHLICTVLYDVVVTQNGFWMYSYLKFQWTIRYWYVIELDGSISYRLMIPGVFNALRRFSITVLSIL